MDWIGIEWDGMGLDGIRVELVESTLLNNNTDDDHLDVVGLSKRIFMTLDDVGDVGNTVDDDDDGNDDDSGGDEDGDDENRRHLNSNIPSGLLQ